MKKGLACAFVVLASIAVCAIYGAGQTNTNPVINDKFAASVVMPRISQDDDVAKTRFPGTVVQPRIDPSDQPRTAFVPIVGADAVHEFGQSLLSANADVEKRLGAVRALQAAAPARDSSIGLREPQAVEILSTAFGRETDERVKLEIVNALSRFNAPEACELLNRALEDGNPAVRKAAQQAKASREQRLRFARCCE